MSSLQIVIRTILVCLVSQAGQAQTSWSELLNFSEDAVVETLTETQSARFEIRVARSKAGGLRLVEVVSLGGPTSAQIQIESNSDISISEQCGKLMYARPKFRAKLNLNLGSRSLVGNIQFEDGQVASTVDLLNLPQISKPLLSFSKQEGSLWIYDPLSERVGTSLQLRLEKLQTLAEQEPSDVLEVDLSKSPGLACDLYSGRTVLTVTRKVSHEIGLPKRESWMKLSTFQTIYSEFWRQLQGVGAGIAPESRQRQLELVALGRATAGKVEFSEMIANDKRIEKLIYSVKLNADEFSGNQKTQLSSKELMSNYLSLQEYIEPATLLTSYTVAVSNGRTFHQ